jgi:hypothetical protein
VLLRLRSTHLIRFSGNNQLRNVERGDQSTNGSVAPILTKVEATENIDDDGIGDCGNDQVRDLERGDGGIDESVPLIPARVQLDGATEDIDELEDRLKEQ